MTPSPLAVGKAGGQQSAPVEPVRFDVTGLDCAACAQTLEKLVAGLEGVETAHVSFPSATLSVAGHLPSEVVVAAVARAGYSARQIGPRRPAPAPFWRRDRRALSTTLSTSLLIVASLLTAWGKSDAIADALYLAALATGGWPTFRATLVALRARSLDMHVLMSAAAVGAVAIGHYGEGAWIMVLFAVGSTLEGVALDRSRRAVEHLMELAPARAHLLAGDIARTVSVEEVRVGQRLLVRPGERIPLDGIILSGSSRVDEAALTAEATPVDKHPGLPVLAGTLNQHGSLTIEVTAAADATTIARVAARVAEAQGSRAPSERLVDRFARFYTPLVFAVAFLVVTLPVIAGGDAHTWIYRGLALLIVACPCALVISVPVSVVSAIGGAARNGVLIKGGQALEDLGKIRAVAVDKTGTLTKGAPELVSIITTGDITEDQALFLMATLEHLSEHPLAAAVVQEADLRLIQLGLVDDFQSLPGFGVCGTIGVRRLWAGGPRLAREYGALLPDALTVMEQRGETAILLGEGDHLLAAFGMADQLRPHAPQAIKQLHLEGIDAVMLTGDNPTVASSVAAEVGIAEWRSGLIPDEKLSVVRSLIIERGVTAMVGDGINDAPALAGATVGVAMGAAGSDLALDSADVALMGDELHRLPDAIRHSRRAVRIMRQNIAVSLGSKVVFVVLAPLGMVSLVDAIVADIGIALLVTLNGLRLLGRKPASWRVAEGAAARRRSRRGRPLRERAT